MVMGRSQEYEAFAMYDSRDTSQRQIYSTRKCRRYTADLGVRVKNER